MYTTMEMRGLKKLEPLPPTRDELRLLDEDAEIREALRGSDKMGWGEWLRSLFNLN